MDEMLSLFEEEASETLNVLYLDLLELEKDPENFELINNIFRYSHTLKGMSGSMEFANMMNLTHKMEDVMDAVRSKKIKVTSEIVDILIECSEKLELMCKEYVENGESSIDVTGLYSSLLGCLNPEQKIEESVSSNEPKNEVDLEPSKEMIKAIKEGQVLSVLQIDPDTQMHGIRVYMFLNNLEQDGVYVLSNPTIEECKSGGEVPYKLTLISKNNEEELKQLIESEYIFKDFSILNYNSVKEKYMSEPAKKEDKPKKENQKKDSKGNNNNNNKNVKISSDKVDGIINLIAELVTEKNRLEIIARESTSENLKETSEKFDRIIGRLQDIAFNIRMVPIMSTFMFFHKDIRNTAKELNKKVNLTIKGEETELDRSIVDSLKEPLIHIIRNSLDHGLESTEERIAKGKPEAGSLRLEARYSDNQVIIEIEDDGKGMSGDFIASKAMQKGLVTEEQVNAMTENEKVNLICLPGFSTAESVSKLSGRGVGLDAVKTYIGRLNGNLEVETKVGKGTTIRLYLPLTLGIMQVLLFNSQNENYAMPLFDVESIITMDQAELMYSNSKEILIYNKKTYPIVHLYDVVDQEPNRSKETFAALINKGDKSYALLVEDIVGQMEVVIKPLGNALNKSREFSAATILGDGSVCLILNSANLDLHK